MQSLSGSCAPSPAPAPSHANGAARRAPRVTGARAIAALQWGVTLLLCAFLIVPVVMSVLAGLTVNYFRGLSSGLTLRWLAQVWEQYQGSVALSLGVAFATLAIVLVVGVPAGYALARSKSRVAREISNRTGWPVLALDTIKNPFLEHLGGGDRLFNRTLGKASYDAIFSVIREAPAGSAFIIDAWFGFQPIELLQTHIGMSGVDLLAEIWCHAPPEMIATATMSRSRTSSAAISASSGSLLSASVPSRSNMTSLFMGSPAQRYRAG